jgi:hypothetical protein
VIPATTAATTPAFLPDERIGLVRVAPTWAALSVPADWGRLVLDVLGDQTGPVFDEPARLHLVWILPADGASDWPDVRAAQVVRYGHGDLLLVPGPDGYHDGTRWLRSPLDLPRYTDPHVLRAGIEFVIGPLEEAAALGPVRVCESCRTPTRRGRLTEEFMGPSGPPYASYACPRCWTAAAVGGEGRHLRAVRRGAG